MSCVIVFKISILSDKSKEELTTYDVIAGYKNGDVFCKTAYETWEKELIIGLTSLANIFDPDNIVISGGLSGEVNYEKIEKNPEDYRPMNDFYINSSHNTYLTGHQLTSESSENMYKIAMENGARLVELDCYDGSDRSIKVTHGYTFAGTVFFDVF